MLDRPNVTIFASPPAADEPIMSSHGLANQHRLYVCPLNISQIYNEERRRFTLVRNQPRKIVEKVASDIENLLAKKRRALDVSMALLIDPTGKNKTKTSLFLSAASETILHKPLKIWCCGRRRRCLCHVSGIKTQFFSLKSH